MMDGMTFLLFLELILVSVGAVVVGFGVCTYDGLIRYLALGDMPT
jgi:hypothetical protein